MTTLTTYFSTPQIIPGARHPTGFKSWGTCPRQWCNHWGTV